jgi:hypothetical protein
MNYLIKIDSKGGKAVFKLSYKNEKFHKLEFVSGKLTQQQHESVMRLCPQLESAILILKKEFEGRVVWEPIHETDAKLYPWMLSVYSEWYYKRFEIKAKITGVECNALKQIIKHLEELAFGKEEEIKAIWQIIFEKWDEQSTFYKGQIELRQINSNLNTILRAIKHGKSATEKGEASGGSDYRKKF